MAADAFASIHHLARKFEPSFGALFGEQLTRFVGLPELDETFITPEGRDVTRCCGASDNGGFSSSKWTMEGWVLDKKSLLALKREFPEEFRCCPICGKARRIRRKARRARCCGS